MTVSIFRYSDADSAPVASFGVTIRKRDTARAMAALRKTSRHCGDLPLPGRDEPIYSQQSKGAEHASSAENRDLPRSGGTQRGDAAEISLPIAALRKFLECPLQGAAQYALGIFEEEAEASKSRRMSRSLSRFSIARCCCAKCSGRLVAIGNSCQIEYAKAFRLSQLAGEAPAGPFAEAAKPDRKSRAMD